MKKLTILNMMYIGTGLNLDFTINPFSQIEVDDQIINLTRFAALPEKRQFFIQNSDLLVALEILRE